MTIPVHTREALDRWVNQGLQPGGFLTAVIDNDLRGAVSKADAENRAALADIVSHINGISGVPKFYNGATHEWCCEKRGLAALGDLV